MRLSAFARGLGLLSVLVSLSCGSSKGGSGNGLPPGSGYCEATCLKDCNVDNDCDVTTGELCCDVPSVGKACLAAAQCPRSCTSDSTCDATKGQACLSVSLDVDGKFCSTPDMAVRTCTSDSSCNTGEKCCGIYSSSICLPQDRCPSTCSSGFQCNTSAGEVCCMAVDKLDPAITAPGLCLASSLCPKACTQSSDCNTSGGELCCNGLCSTNCVKTCQTSNDCPGQLCCKNPVSITPRVPQTGFPVATTGTGGSLGTGGSVGTGGSLGTGGVKGTGGSPGTGGVKGTGGSLGTGGVKGTGGSVGTGGTTGTHCAGTPLYTCVTCGATYGCTSPECPGCLAGATTGSCSGYRYYTCADFNYYSDPYGYQCAATPGCYYDYLYGCSGTPEPCDYIPDQTTCSQQLDCNWIPGTTSCTGTPLACSQLSVSTCLEPGCAVQ